jgi:hypothetical protein
MLKTKHEWHALADEALRQNLFRLQQPEDRLRYALRTGNRYLIERLFLEHPELHHVNVWSRNSPLFYCVRWMHMAAAEILLPITPEACFQVVNYEYNIIMRAVELCHDDFLDAILALRIDNGINKYIDEGRNVLSVAKAHSGARFVKILGHPSFDPRNWTTGTGFGALDIMAPRLNIPEVQETFQDRWGLKARFGQWKVSVVHKIADDGTLDHAIWTQPDIDQRDGFGNGTAHYIVRSDNVDMVRKFLEDKRIDWSIKSDVGQTAVWWSRSPEVLQLFWEKGMVDCRMLSRGETLADVLLRLGRIPVLARLVKLSLGSRSIAPGANHLMKSSKLRQLLDHPQVVRVVKNFGYLSVVHTKFMWNVETLRLTLRKRAILGSLQGGAWRFYSHFKKFEVDQRIGFLTVFHAAETRRMKKVEHPYGLDTFVRDPICDPGLMRIIFSYL